MSSRSKEDLGCISVLLVSVGKPRLKKCHKKQEVKIMNLGYIIKRSGDKKLDGSDHLC